MSMFFKDSLKSNLINEYGLEKDLVKRRFQLLGYKLFKKCASGQPVAEKDLVKRVIYLNKTKNLGFVVKDLISGCKLSETPKDDEATQIATEKLLNDLESFTEEDLEKYDVIDEAYTQDKLPISRDVLEYGIKPLVPKRNFELKTTVDSHGKKYLTLFNNLNNTQVAFFEKGLSDEVAKEFMRTVDANLSLNFMDFYLKWSDKVDINPVYGAIHPNNLRMISRFPRSSRKNLKTTVVETLLDPQARGNKTCYLYIRKADNVLDIYNKIFERLLMDFPTIFKNWSDFDF